MLEDLLIPALIRTKKSAQLTLCRFLVIARNVFVNAFFETVHKHHQGRV